MADRGLLGAPPAELLPWWRTSSATIGGELDMPDREPQTPCLPDEEQVDSMERL